MQLFMFISGYLVFNKPIKLLKKFKSLIIPFIVWYTIGFISQISKTNHLNFSDYYLQILISPDNGLWFLYILFLNFVLLKFFQELAKVIKNVIRINIVLLEFYLSIVFWLILEVFYYPYLGLPLLAKFFIFFLLGYLFKFLKQKYKLKFNIKYLLLSLLTYIILFIIYTNSTAIFDYIQINDIIIKFINLFSKIILAISAIAFIFSIKPPSSLLQKILIYLGNITLEIYVIHQLLIFPIGVFPAFFIALILSILFLIVIHKSKPFSLLLFGK